MEIQVSQWLGWAFAYDFSGYQRVFINHLIPEKNDNCLNLQCNSHKIELILHS